MSNNNNLETIMKPSENQSPVDIVTTYHKYINGTVEITPSKKWLDSMENQVALFLGKLFSVKGFEKPIKDVPKPMELCAKNPSVKEYDLVIFNVASLINQLGDPALSKTLPLLANLIFLAKQDFSAVKTETVQKLVAKFQEMITSQAYVSSELPEARLKRLLDVVDSIRKYSEHLIFQTGGYSVGLKMGDSPRKILRNLLRVRERNSMGGSD